MRKFKNCRKISLELPKIKEISKDKVFILLQKLIYRNTKLNKQNILLVKTIARDWLTLLKEALAKTKEAK